MLEGHRPQYEVPSDYTLAGNAPTSNRLPGTSLLEPTERSVSLTPMRPSESCNS